MKSSDNYHYANNKVNEPELLFKLNIKREPGWLYYVDPAGDVVRCRMNKQQLLFHFWNSFSIFGTPFRSY